MIRNIQLVLSILPLVLGLEGLSFAQSLRNQTLSAIGGSTQSHSAGLLVQQSIGQSSITGTYTTNAAILSQGFLRGVSAPSKEIRPHFGAIAFPNAFTQHISFRFTNTHREQTQVSIFDSQGKMVYQQQHLPIKEEIDLQLHHLAPGLYVVQLSSGALSTQLRILKKY